MTREEAIALLKSRVDLIKSDYPEIDDYCEALEMAIEALEQEPYEKFESTKDHIYKLASDYKCWDNRLTSDEALELCHILEQKPILDRDCEHCSKTYGTLGCCDTVSNEWVYSCKEGQREYLLNKIRTEIEGKYRVILKGTPKDDWAVIWNECIDDILQIIDKYKAESEV